MRCFDNERYNGPVAPATSPPDAAHIERPALEIALLESALRAGAKIDVLREDLVQEFRRGIEKANVYCSTRAADLQSPQCNELAQGGHSSRGCFIFRRDQASAVQA